MSLETIQTYLTRAFFVSMAIGIASVLGLAKQNPALGGMIARISLAVGTPLGLAIFVIALRRYLTTMRGVNR